jgi:hypothetical protein
MTNTGGMPRLEVRRARDYRESWPFPAVTKLRIDCEALQSISVAEDQETVRLSASLGTNQAARAQLEAAAPVAFTRAAHYLACGRAAQPASGRSSASPSGW